MVENKNLKQIIVDEYIDQTLTRGIRPVSVYEFCKKLKIEESDFYNYFGSFNSIERFFWETILSDTVQLVEADVDDFQNGHHYLLSFYYTLFENLKLNRSFILYLSATKKGQIELDLMLRDLFSNQLGMIAQKLHNPIHEISEEVGDKISKEALWFQFVMLFNFWQKDDSKGFEKTDAFIEKSVRLGVDLSENLPTESILDFGKFIFKELKSIV